MDSSIVVILVAFVGVLFVLKFIKGIIKLAVLVAIVAAAFYFLSQGSL